MDAERSIILTAQLLEARDAMRKIFGKTWGMRVAELEEIMIARRRVTAETKLACAVACANIAQKDGKASLAVQFLAAAVELETKKP